jgi:glutamyl-tRNA synthetase
VRPTTRLAPSPTGALHLGNARTFLINWLLARQRGWRIILRIEDIDGPRVRADATGQIIEDLQWLGLDWDEGPFLQSTRQDFHRTAVNKLVEQRIAYPCVCSRSEVELASSAPHAEDGASVYPGTCRDRFASLTQAQAESGRPPAIRFDTRGASVSFLDRVAGPCSVDVERQLGDFVIAKADGSPAYQIAVVVDDSDAGVTHVVRGDDLIESAARQQLIYRALGIHAMIPAYYHLPLLVGMDGRRLAKRHGDTRLAHYRRIGVPVERVLLLLARWSGMEPTSAPAHARDLLSTFDLGCVTRGRVTMSSDDELFLRGKLGG